MAIHNTISAFRMKFFPKHVFSLAVLSAVLLSGLAVITVLAAAPSEGVVVEGVSVPGVALGFTRAEVEAAWGAPDYCQNVNGYDQGSCKFTAEDGGTIFVRYRGADGGVASASPNDVVHFIHWYQLEGWVTTAGVNTILAYNDPDAVMAAYPDATINQQSLFDWSIDDPATGIHVYYHTDYLSGVLTVSMAISFPADPPPPQEEFFIQVISILFNTVQKNKTTASIMVRDDQGQRVEGAVVSATWTMPDGSQVALNGSTDSYGNAYFELGKLKRHGTYTLNIEDVVITGFTFDRDHSVLNASITK